MIDKLIDKFHQYFPNLASGGGSVSTGIEAVAGIALLGFLYFVFFAKKSYRNPFWALIVGVFGIVVFLGFFYAGLQFGKATGLGEICALIGVFIFFLLGTVLKYYMTPKERRGRKMF